MPYKNPIDGESYKIHSITVLLCGVFGLLIFVFLQVSQVRSAILFTASFLLGRPIDMAIWSAFLLKNSVVILAISLSLILYYDALKYPSGRFAHFILLVIRAINQITYNRKALYIVGFLILVTFIVTGYLTGTSMYSPDSWSFFELANSVFGEYFYKFNTYRSYFSETYSASFPLGYPFLLAVGHLLFGSNPTIAIAANVLMATLLWFLIIKLARQLNLSGFAGLALASSTVLWIFFLDEVFSGRSMPASLLFFILGSSLFLSHHVFVGGLFLGFSALVRFDYLAFSIFIQLVAFMFFRVIYGKKLFLLTSGFCVGISPWVFYSVTHFGRLWVSDNSWVALSALPAHVLNFPAAAAQTVFDSPLIWLERVVSNTLPLTRSIAYSAIRFPLIISLVICFILFRNIDKSLRNTTIARLALLSTSLTPYLLVGYFDYRYFVLFYLVASAFLFYAIEFPSNDTRNPGIHYTLIMVSLVFSLALGGHYISKKLWIGFTKIDAPDLVLDQMEHIGNCHTAYPNTIYIFAGGARDIGFRYGAITGRPTAIIPSNYGEMTAEEKDSYFDFMKPYVLIDSLEYIDKCGFRW